MTNDHAAGDAHPEPDASQFDPKADSLSWPGQLEAFAPLTEGGPGRARNLGIIAAISCLGVVLLVLEDQEISPLSGLGYPASEIIAYSSGFAGMVALLTVGLYMLMRLAMRDRNVTFYMTPEGAEVRPSARQQRADALISGAATAVAFSQRARIGPWLPSTKLGWHEVRRADLILESRQILLKARRGSLRFHCPDGATWSRARAIVEANRDRIRRIRVIAPGRV